MKKPLIIVYLFVGFLIITFSNNLLAQNNSSERIIIKDSGRIILAYKDLTTLIIKDPSLSKSIPIMPESSVKWCFDNEKLIKASIITELNDTTFNCLKKFIADGPVSTPPPGFVEKTGYFAGYRIIEACIKKGMKLEEICSLNSDTVLVKSGYFN